MILPPCWPCVQAVAKMSLCAMTQLQKLTSRQGLTLVLDNIAPCSTVPQAYVRTGPQTPVVRPSHVTVGLQRHLQINLHVVFRVLDCRDSRLRIMTRSRRKGASTTVQVPKVQPSSHDVTMVSQACAQTCCLNASRKACTTSLTRPRRRCWTCRRRCWQPSARSVTCPPKWYVVA